MAEEIVKVLKIDTGESEVTVKSLRSEIKELRDNILNLEKGTDDYDKAVQQLQSDQRKLDDVMSLTKKNAVALDGSYDALTQKMSALKKEWRATNDEAKRNELGKQINEINNQLKAMDATTGNFSRNVGNYSNDIVDAFGKLRKDIKQLKGELLTLDEGSEQYAKTMEELADKTFQLRDMQEKAKYSTNDFGEQLANVSGIASGLVSGFGAVQGVMVLAGKDTENFEKTMVKITATMSIVQGLEGMEGLIDKIGGLKIALKASTAGLSGFKKALIGTGIGAIVVLVGTLVANWEDLTKWIEKSIGSLDRFREMFAGIKNVIGNFFSNTFKALGKAFTGNFKEASELMKKAIDVGTAYAEGASQKRIEIAEKEVQTKAELAYKDTENYIKDQEAKIGADWKWSNEGIASYRKMFAEKLKMYKKDSDEYKEALREKWAFERELASKGGANIEIGDIADANIKVDTSIAKLSSSNNAGEFAKGNIAGVEREYRKQMNDAILLDEKERYEKEYELTKKFNEDKLRLLEEAYKKETDPEKKEGLRQEALDQRIENERFVNEELARLRDEDVENQKSAEERKALLISESVNAISDILGSMADIYQTNLDAQLRTGKISEKEYEKQLKKVKAIQIAQATISTIKGAVDAYMSMASIPFVGPALGAIAAATVTAAGIAQINQIKNTDAGSSSIGQMGGGVGSVTPDSGMIEKPIDTNVHRQLTGQSEIDEMNKSQRVYILESDIQDSGNRVKVREDESTF